MTPKLYTIISWREKHLNNLCHDKGLVKHINSQKMHLINCFSFIIYIVICYSNSNGQVLFHNIIWDLHFSFKFLLMAYCTICTFTDTNSCLLITDLNKNVSILKKYEYKIFLFSKIYKTLCYPYWHNHSAMTSRIVLLLYFQRTLHLEIHTSTLTSNEGLFLSYLCTIAIIISLPVFNVLVFFFF